MLSLLDVPLRSKNFTSHAAIRMPPSVPLNHYFDPKTNRKNRSPIPLFHAQPYKQNAYIEHSDLFKVICQPLHQVNEDKLQKTDKITQDRSCCIHNTTSTGTDPTTSFLTAAMTIYAMRAGITAAAGTRLALS